MLSTSNSEKEDVVLSIENFSVIYDVPYYKSQSMRDLFVGLLTSPFDYFLRQDDKIIVIDDLSLKLKRGERLGILGNNGSGKSSLCRYISGLHGNAPQIIVNGRIKAIFETEAVVMPELSGRENLEILVHMFYPECGNEEHKAIIDDVESFCDLGKFLDTPFKLYSKGMRARLFLSLISARPTDLLILDEVFNGADHFFSEKITKRVKMLIEQSGAVIFISHSFETVKEVCNRVIVLNDRKIVFDGRPEEGIKFYKEHCEQTVIQDG